MKLILTERAPKPIGPYSQAVLVGDTLYCSGQIPLDSATGELAGADIAAQTEKAVENIGGVLWGAGMGFKNVVKTTCFLTDMDNFGGFNAVYEKYFTSKPARSTVAVRELPKGALIEIEAVAVR
jgi:2-iminobutanoate/2-iminopropanoate deaminase